MNSKGQVTVFVIIAIVIVAVIALFFAFRGYIFGEHIPASLAPVYSRYSECITEEVRNGVSLLQSQGGRINLGDLGYASAFNPFSSNLNFLGVRVPYWYGFSGNNLVIENVPKKSEMESDIESFIESRINNCDFSDFYAQGFVIETSQPDASVTINDNDISVNVNAPLSVSFNDESARKSNHELTFDSRLGTLYNEAISFYNNERKSLFLENYALDVLESYAPVDGVEIQCSPKIWKTNEVVNEIKSGLAANLGAVGAEGSDKYFTNKFSINENLNVLYLPEAFPSKIEVTPATQTVMLAEPMGTQEGLGLMGFCYVPYHFVYDVRFPVMVQIGDGVENFQFPLVVDIDNNVVNPTSIGDFIEPEDDVDICSFAENDITVNTYDTSLNPIVANVSFRCFDSSCELGETKLAPSGAVLNTKIPACVNGELVASAEGYADSKVLFSSNSNDFAELILEKEYPLTVEIKIGGKIIRNATAVVHFVEEDGSSTSAIVPESSNIQLKEGLYKIEAFVYGNSNVQIPSTRKTECFKTSRGGIQGFFGGTKEECVNVEIPATKIDYALLGGGKLDNYYLLGSELSSGKLVIDVSELAPANSLEQLQYNYEAFNTLGLEVSSS